MGISFAQISKQNRARITLAVKISFTFLVIVFIFAKVDFALIRESFVSANPALLLLAALLMLLNFAVQFVKWEIIVEKIIGKTKKSVLLKSLLFGISSAMITPLQTGVYVGRAAAFEKEKIPRVVFATFFDKITMLILTAFSGAMISLYFLATRYQVSDYVTVPLLFLILTLGGIFFVILSSDKIENSKLISALLPRKIADKFSDKIALANYLSSELFWKTLPLFALQKIILLAQFAALIYAFGGTGNFLHFTFAALLVFFSKSFFPPITVGDIGVREAMAIFFFGFLGVPEQTAFNAAMFLFVLNLLFPSLISLIFIFRGKN